ncbi:MAG TPA: hypothetical protein VE242_00185, partial [Chthoniobacterales bacterium]|nr:hypothetical protein [Chthoniobacterales bacterium]
MSGDLDVLRGVTNAIQIPDAGLVRAIAEFCRFARARGLSASTKKLIGCLQALRTVSSGGVTTFKFVLRTVLCSSREDWVLFDALFAEFWQNTEPKRDLHPKNSGS